jgi:hypothetical protein
MKLQAAASELVVDGDLQLAPIGELGGECCADEAAVPNLDVAGPCLRDQPVSSDLAAAFDAVLIAKGT